MPRRFARPFNLSQESTINPKSESVIFFFFAPPPERNFFTRASAARGGPSLALGTNSSVKIETKLARTGSAGSLSREEIPPREDKSGRKKVCPLPERAPFCRQSSFGNRGSIASRAEEKVRRGAAAWRTWDGCTRIFPGQLCASIEKSP